MKFFTKEWRKNNLLEDDTIKNYQNYLKTLRPYVSDEFLTSLHLHDAVLKECVSTGNNLRLSFNIHHSCTFVEEIILEEAHVVCDDGIARGDIWLYEELYLSEKEYELHILFDSQTGLKQFIVKAKNIKFSNNDHKKRQDEKVRRWLHEYHTGNEEQRRAAFDKLREAHKEEI